MNVWKKSVFRIYDKYIRPPLYTLREWWPFWFNVLNRRARLLYRAHPQNLTRLEQRLAKELGETGIATTSLSELFGDEYSLDELHKYIRTLPPPLKEEIAMKKTAIQTRLWSVKPTLDFKNPFLRLALDSRVLRISHAYMHMWTKLKYYDLAITHRVADSAEAQYSQRWHRDPEEKRMVKLFIYLTDVDGGCGPFTYIPGSPYGMEPYGSVFPQKPPAGSYMDDNEFNTVVPLTAHRVMTGKAGTIILCDTSGLHRGGYATTGERLMFTSFYSAPSSTQGTWYHLEKGAKIPDSLSAESVFALE